MYKYSETMEFPADQAISPSAEVIKITGRIAKPSRPSVKFTALELPTIIKIETGMNNIPRENETSLKNGTM